MLNWGFILWWCLYSCTLQSLARSIAWFLLKFVTWQCRLHEQSLNWGQRLLIKVEKGSNPSPLYPKVKRKNKNYLEQCFYYFYSVGFPYVFILCWSWFCREQWTNHISPRPRGTKTIISPITVIQTNLPQTWGKHADSDHGGCRK